MPKVGERMSIIKLKSAEDARNNITKYGELKIRSLYKEASKDIQKLANELKGKENISSILRMAQLDDLNREVTKIIQNITPHVEHLTLHNMQNVSQAVVDDMSKTWAKYGINTAERFMGVPRQAVANIATGNVYENGWNLSARIWGVQEKTLSDIHSVIAKDTAMNKSTYEIAKDLEKYVDPKARKNWEWSKVYPGTNKTVDYNAQRLARTLVQHTYQQTTEDVCKHNPFIDGYIWSSACIHGRTCQECLDMDGQFFTKEEVPFDHPNGLCVIIPHVQSLLDVADRLAEWVKAPYGTYPDIDAFGDKFN